ncbi:MAG: M56 family metallopeptidase [Lachnospiraceae bacterium]|nr:M56 family metallopeptidase [Lachnospiraceae bacterium]
MTYGVFNKNLIAKVPGSTSSSVAGMVQMDVTDSVQTEMVNGLDDFVHAVYARESAVLSLPAYMVSLGSAIWACGCVILLLHAIMNYLLLKKNVQASVLLYENIRICDGIRTPFLLGYRKPQIFLPSDIDRTQLPYIVAHESVHLKRRDYIWKTLVYAVAVLHWFNPFVWIAWHTFCKDLELSCDEKAIQKLGQKEKKSYACALLACSNPATKNSVFPLAFGQNEVKERIRCIMKKDKSRTTKWMSNLLAVSLFLAALCITAYAETEYVSEAAGDSQGTEETDSQTRDEADRHVAKGTASQMPEEEDRRVAEGEDGQVTKATETDAYLGGYSEDGGINEEAGQSSTASETFRTKMEASSEAGENEILSEKTVVILYSENDELTGSETNPGTNPEAQQILYISEKLAPDSDDEWEGYGFESLLPGEEQDSGESFDLTEGTMVYYQVLYTRAGLNIDVILTYEDEDAWWSVEFTGGEAEGAFCIPADGSYRLSVRCSESNLQYEETALDPIEISGTVVYYIG